MLYYSQSYGRVAVFMISFLPDFVFRKLTDIPPSFFAERGLKLILLDFDNTMLPYTCDEPTQDLLAWIDRMRASGLRLCIVSNSKKPRVPRFSERYGVACVTHAGKPGGRGIREAMRRFGCRTAQTALIGDQIYTDVLGAKCAGITAIAVRSIHNHNVALKLRHVLELPFLALVRKRRIYL